MYLRAGRLQVLTEEVIDGMRLRRLSVIEDLVHGDPTVPRIEDPESARGVALPKVVEDAQAFGRDAGRRLQSRHLGAVHEDEENPLLSNLPRQRRRVGGLVGPGLKKSLKTYTS